MRKSFPSLPQTEERRNVLKLISIYVVFATQMTFLLATDLSES